MGLNDSDRNNMYMPVQPMMGAYGGNNGFGCGNDWWILLFLFALWGGNGNWGNNGNNGAGAVLPYFTAQNTDAAVQRGFDQSAVIGQLSDIQNSLTTGFASAEVADCNRAMNNLQRSFDAQTAVTQGINGVQTQIANGMSALQSQLASCCCENRLATCQTQNTIVSEASNNRFQSAQNTRDIIDNDNRNNQAILDKLCQIELDNLKAQIEAKNDVIAQLRTDLNMAGLAASQNQQTAQIIADNAMQSANLRELIAPQIRPAYIVSNPNGCNCGNAACGSF